MYNNINYKDDNALEKNDMEVIRYLYDRKNKFLDEVDNNITLYNETIEAYDEYIDYIAYLIKCMNLPSNVISASIILSLLMRKGIFSEDNRLITNEENLVDLYGFLGLNIIIGHAACRHFAAFQSDVLKRLKYMSEPFYCYMTKDDVSDASKKPANHAINLIEYKDNLYGIDTYNSSFFNFIDSKKMVEMFVKRPHFVYYKPYINIMYNGETTDSVNNLCNLFDNIKGKESISIDEFKYICDYAQKVVFKNNDLLDAFHESSKKYIKRITKSL